MGILLGLGDYLFLLRALVSLECPQALGYEEKLPLALDTEWGFSVLALILARLLIVRILRFLVLVGGETASEGGKGLGLACLQRCPILRRFFVKSIFIRNGAVE